MDKGLVGEKEEGLLLIHNAHIITIRNRATELRHTIEEDGEAAGTRGASCMNTPHVAPDIHSFLNYAIRQSHEIVMISSGNEWPKSP